MADVESVLNRLYRWLRETPASRGSRELVMDRAEAAGYGLGADPLSHYDPSGLYDVFRHYDRPVVGVDPKNFAGGLAHKLPGEDWWNGGLTERDAYIRELADVALRGPGLEDVPQLWLTAGELPGPSPESRSSFLEVTGHEGRHRTTGLARAGEPLTLLGLNPEMGAQDPRWREVLRNLDNRTPVMGESRELTGYWPGGQEFPFIGRYRAGGHP